LLKQAGFSAYCAKKFEENVGELVSKLKEIDKTAAIMCAELDQEKCHRRYIVGEIRNRGIDVTVIDKYNKSANKNTLVAYS